MKKIYLSAVFALVLGACSTTALAQVNGGRQVFQFLTLSPSARATALGGAQISVRDEDVSLAALNPAALNPLMDGRLAFNHNFFLTDIQHGYVAYAHTLPKINMTVQGGIQYLNYGDIVRADEYGNRIGTVPASENAFLLGAARPLSDKLTLGLNARMAFSRLDMARASALSTDIGLMYADTVKRMNIAFVWRNLGTQTANYFDTKEAMESNLQIAFSKRLRYLPFRLSVLAHTLNRWDIRYDDPALEDDQVLSIGGDNTDQDKGNPGVDNFFRHFIFNGEFLLGRNESFRLRIGYNHMRKRELTVRNYRSLAGFSGGVGIKINRFRLDVGYGSYHLAGGVMHLGLSTNLKDFF
ncbi:MAG: type IX secretion system protein PorQ [Chitinophagales bacterium]|nr:type IX secretion system protein PorQ [Chitinophagales bacterium]